MDSSEFEDDFELIDAPGQKPSVVSPDDANSDAPRLESATSNALPIRTAAASTASSMTLANADAGKATVKHVVSNCHNPYCQLSHSSIEAERKSERAIEPLVALMQKTAKAIPTGPIFHAKLSDSRDVVFETFVGSLPEQYRRVMNCSTCRHFLRRYGSLCVVRKDGTLQPVMWPESIDKVPDYYKPAVTNVLKLFENRNVGEEFRIFGEAGRVLGIPTAGGWNHMSITLADMPVSHKNMSMDSQDTTTSFTMLDRIVTDYPLAVIARAHHMIVGDQLPYATSHKPPMTWLHTTAKALEAQTPTNKINRKNLITNYARSAYPGCISSLRGGLLGFLLECVNEGQDFETVKRNWQSKADPISYLRPTAAPSAGNILNAEKEFARLGYTPNDLARVYLVEEQVPKSAILWKDAAKPDPAPPQSMFGHLLPKASAKTERFDGPAKDISFRKFALEVLPDAKSINLKVGEQMSAYFFTIGREGSKPLMAHHSETNTASWYTWTAPCRSSRASLTAGMIRVTSIITFPHMWEHISPLEALESTKSKDFKFIRHGIRYLFCLQGVKETTGVGLALFPTLMRGEFHAVRKTVEAFSIAGKMDQPPAGKEHVGGIVGGESKAPVEVSVIGIDGLVSRYNITLFE